MTTDESLCFFREIVAAPEDDAPRLIYADWLEERGDPLGALIRIQCELARLETEGPRYVDLRLEEWNLLHEYGAEWDGTLPKWVSAFERRRGFVERVALPYGKFHERAELLFDEHPIRDLTLEGRPERLTRILEEPLMLRVESLSLAFLDDEGLRSVVESPYLENVRSLRFLDGRFTRSGMRAIAWYAEWPRLTQLSLVGCLAPLGRNAGFADKVVACNVLAETDRLDRVERLDLSGNDLSAAQREVLRARYGSRIVL